MLAAAVHSPAADSPVPPPPAAGETAAAGPAGKFAGSGENHHPALGLVKQVEQKGKVTKEEFLAQVRRQAEEMFSKLDKNGDGVVDKSEVAEIEQKMKNLREKMQERGGSSGPRKRPGA